MSHVMNELPNEYILRDDWRTCKRDEARIIDIYYHELQRNIRVQINELAILLELLEQMELS